MSWSGSVVLKKGATREEMIHALEDMKISGQDDLARERDDAVDFCKGVVVEALANGTLGKLEEHAWNVNICGHATSGNDGGIGVDALSISITQAPWLEETPAASK